MISIKLFMKGQFNIHLHHIKDELQLDLGFRVVNYLKIDSIWSLLWILSESYF